MKPPKRTGEACAPNLRNNAVRRRRARRLAEAASKLSPQLESGRAKDFYGAIYAYEIRKNRKAGGYHRAGLIRLS
jgi:hypothetical protein